jgi:hypothetical protein
LINIKAEFILGKKRIILNKRNIRKIANPFAPNQIGKIPRKSIIPQKLTKNKKNDL